MFVRTKIRTNNMRNIVRKRINSVNVGYYINSIHIPRSKSTAM